MDYTKLNKISGILLAIDMEKVFDSLKWQFPYKALKYFNYDESFFSWIYVLYSDPKSCVINNGFCAQYFPLQKGVHQGDPISHNLFILAIKLPALNVQQCKNIQGISVNNVNVIMCQFANDIT